MSSESIRLVRPGVKDDARSDLLAAAAVEFMAHGYSAASMDAIADRLGATKGRIYHYYRSKAALYLDLLRDATEVAIAAVEPIATSDQPPIERLRLMAVAHVRLIVEDFARQRVSAQGLVPETNAAVRGGLEHVREIRDYYEQLFVTTIAASVADGSLRQIDAGFAVKPFLGALNWTVFWYRPDTGADDTLALELAEFAIRGLRPD